MLNPKSLAVGLDRPSQVPRLGPWIWATIVVVSTIWLLGPRLSGWQLLHVHKEDGSIFLQQWVSQGWSSLFEPYTGYQHLGARAATAVCASGPVPWFASCIGVAAGGFRVALAIVAVAVLVPYAHVPRWGLAAGLMFVFVPVGQQEVLGNLTNLRWFFDVGCLLICVGLFRRRMAAVAALLGFIGAMSDPLVLLLLPLAAWRVVTAPDRKRALPAVAVATGAVLHWLLLIPSARAADFAWFMRDPLEAASQLAVRGLAVTQFGQNGTEVLLHVSVLFACLAALAPLVVVLMSRPTRVATALVVLLLVSGLALLAATLLFAPREPLELDPAWQLGNASRYSVGAALLIGSALLVAVSHARKPWVRWATGTVLVAAALADMTGDSWNSHGPTWRESVDTELAVCAAGADTVDVELTPTDVPMDWRAELSCEWLTG